MEPVLLAQDLVVDFGAVRAVAGFDLSVAAGHSVALVGRNSPLGIVIAALLFATLSQGGLAVNALVPKQMVDVLQAVVILAVATAVPAVRESIRSAAKGVVRSLVKKTPLDAPTAEVSK